MPRAASIRAVSLLFWEIGCLLLIDRRRGSALSSKREGSVVILRAAGRREAARARGFLVVRHNSSSWQLMIYSAHKRSTNWAQGTPAPLRTRTDRFQSSTPADRGCRSTSPSLRSAITLYGLSIPQDSYQTIIKRSGAPRNRHQLVELVDRVSFLRHHPAQGFQLPGETDPGRLLPENSWNVYRQHDRVQLRHSSG